MGPRQPKQPQQKTEVGKEVVLRGGLKFVDNQAGDGDAVKRGDKVTLSLPRTILAVVTFFPGRIHAQEQDVMTMRIAQVVPNVYVISGFISALAGWVLIGRVGAVSPTSGQDANLDSITAVVIGGTSLFGGRGSIIMLELADDDSAKKVAQRIATETGRRVTIRDADMTVIQTIPAAKIH